MAVIPSASYSMTIRLEIIINSIFDKRVVERVAAAVSAAADESGLVQRKKLRSPRR